ncbi:MAG: F0F1 ATP synthase subunit gamma, partial [Proteobacteria bacterium]|nr:F0F1 ATP synthase subunit gamma [Pseudomonadota bacterium]
MAQLREIKNRIKAVGNIQRITKTMQMIATAKFQASVRRTQATQPYTNKISEIAGELSQSAGDIDHSPLSPPLPPMKRQLILVPPSNRGLCGAYNAHVHLTSINTLHEKHN